jgi:REP element-mobilizing transposase RayT
MDLEEMVKPAENVNSVLESKINELVEARVNELLAKYGLHLSEKNITGRCNINKRSIMPEHIHHIIVNYVSYSVTNILE